MNVDFDEWSSPLSVKGNHLLVGNPRFFASTEPCYVADNGDIKRRTRWTGIIGVSEKRSPVVTRHTLAAILKDASWIGPACKRGPACTSSPAKVQVKVPAVMSLSFAKPFTNKQVDRQKGRQADKQINKQRYTQNMKSK